MSDQAKADDLNTFYLDAAADDGALFNYLAKETARDHSTEPVPSHILGRLQRVVAAGAAGIGTEIFVGSETPGPFANLTAEEMDACFVLLQVAQQDRLCSLSHVMTETKFVDMLNFVKDAGVMKPADVTAIHALSQNQQSRATELGLPFVKLGNIQNLGF